MDHLQPQTQIWNRIHKVPLPKNLDNGNFRRRQRFVFHNGVPMEENLEKKVPKVPEADRLLGTNPFKDCNPPVLTFNAYYCEPQGEGNKLTTRFRKCNVLYFLADDEIKVYEPRQKNSGLNQGCIVRRGRFYKPDGDGHYTIDDLNIGETLVLFGREYKLINCDAFTRKFLTEMGYRVRVPEPEIKDPFTEDRKQMDCVLYHQRRGMAKKRTQENGAKNDNNERIRISNLAGGSDEKSLSKHLPEPNHFPTPKLVYPHEMFGEPEQTIRTNDPFTPIRYVSELKKFFKNDKYAYDVREFKFLARVITEEPLLKLRVFLVRWFLEDDTMDIRAIDLDFENASMLEHKYLKRMKIVKPRPSVGNFERCYYQPKDLFVGNVIYVRGRAFLLMDADEYTYDYMERNCHSFQHSNVKRIMTSLRQWAKDNWDTLEPKFKDKDPGKTACVNYEDFRDAIHEVMTKEEQKQYPEHAIKTIARHYADDKYSGLKVDDLASIIRTELYRTKYYNFDDLKLALEIQDDEKTGLLSPKRLYFALRAASVPLNRDLLKSFIYKYPSTNGKIKYSDVLYSIDWLKNHTQYEKQDPYAIHINWEHIEYEKDLDKIKYNCFLTDVVI